MYIKKNAAKVWTCGIETGLPCVGDELQPKFMTIQQQQQTRIVDGRTRWERYFGRRRPERYDRSPVMDGHVILQLRRCKQFDADGD